MQPGAALRRQSNRQRSISLQTLSELLRSHARHFKHKTYLVCEDKSWTYGEYFSQVEKLAQVLVEHGVSKGQPVCLYLPSRPELAFAYHACQLIGAIATPMSSMYRSAELNKIVARTGASVLITDTERAPLVRRVRAGLATLQHLLVFGGDDQAAPLEDLLPRTVPHLPEDTVGPEDVAALFFTSGTTGEPKGAMQNQRNILAAIRGGEVYTACASGKEVFLGVLPLFNNFGATVVLNGALYNGGTLVLRERWDLDGVVADIERHKISVFFGTPTMFTFLLKAYDPQARSFIAPLVPRRRCRPRALACRGIREEAENPADQHLRRNRGLHLRHGEPLMGPAFQAPSACRSAARQSRCLMTAGALWSAAKPARSPLGRHGRPRLLAGRKGNRNRIPQWRMAQRRYRLRR
jgi:acyl-CoA synthetase (AMP-forming)/AMP-acid ligase II